MRIQKVRLQQIALSSDYNFNPLDSTHKGGRVLHVSLQLLIMYLSNDDTLFTLGEWVPMSGRRAPSQPLASPPVVPQNMSPQVSSVPPPNVTNMNQQSNPHTMNQTSQYQVSSPPACHLCSVNFISY